MLLVERRTVAAVRRVVANLPGAQADVNSNYMDGGVAYMVSSRLQLDAYAGKGLNGPGRDLYFGIGIAVKF